MPECPICATTYTKGKSEHCHVCGWQFEAAGVSTIGPVRIKHQLSRQALTKIEAWAHHLWTSLQQQKQRLTVLQAEQASSPPRPLPTVTLRSAHGHRLVDQGGAFAKNGTIAPTPNPTRPSVATPFYTGAMPTVAETGHFAETVPAPNQPWTLSHVETPPLGVPPFEAMQPERSQLQFQVSQLRAEIQRLQNNSSTAIAPQHSPTTALALQPDLSELEQKLEAVWQMTLTKTQSELKGELETAWQTTLAKTQSDLKQDILQSQTQFQDAIAMLMQTHQVQQQTLLTQQSTIHALQNQLHTQAQAYQEQQQRLLNMEQVLTTICQHQQEQRTWLETQLQEHQSHLAAQVLSPSEWDAASIAIQQLQTHLTALQEQVQHTQQQFQTEVKGQFEELRSHQVDTAAQIATANQQLHDLGTTLTQADPSRPAALPSTVPDATQPSHTIYTRYY